MVMKRIKVVVYVVLTALAALLGAAGLFFAFGMSAVMAGESGPGSYLTD